MLVRALEEKYDLVDLLLVDLCHYKRQVQSCYILTFVLTSFQVLPAIAGAVELEWCGGRH